MNDCIFCGSEIISKLGKKQRKFCNGNCRNKYYYKINNDGRVKKKPGRKPKKNGLPLPKDFLETNGPISGVDANGKVVIRDITNPNVDIKPIIPPQTNYSINTSGNEEKMKRIAILEHELKNPPKNPLIGMRTWLAVRQNEVNKLTQEIRTANQS